ncbi:site-2 protease family protein [Halocatena pleomorpha]|uniref:Site-2 protease family protein n=1 Tax=Halocatena pleomorpha TaxID=1785090 RepID=A0A3P3RE03_9EURY|nr:site-2 protease family protein [Halocatena pleomorpha]RRJ31706.1 site-2 protease family protein [Halocatena pleomorpha]
MAGTDEPVGGPPAEAFSSVFDVTEIRREDDRLLYFGEPTVSPAVLEQHVWPLFREHGYEVQLATVSDDETDPITGVEISTERQALVAEQRSIGVDGVPWYNLLFGLLTIVTTLYAGLQWYGLDGSDPTTILNAWPFALAVLGVLGIHELGHYVMSRYHRVSASLPYFIPVPTIFGTMGAVIKMKGRIPSRKALFDIGVAGPLAGLIAAVVVTTVGLQLNPVTVEGPIYQIQNLNYPPLIQIIAVATDSQLTFAESGQRVNPVVVGGWVGMFVTFLNLLPVGQLDGGHLLRAMLGKRQETVAALVPAVLFVLGSYLLFVREFALESVFLWFFWGLITIGFAYAGPAHPIRDEPLDSRRIAIGVITFVLGLLCFTPVPFQLV